MADGVRVTFAPSGAEADVSPGATLLAAARLAGLLLPAPCGGRGACGRCAVTVESGRLVTASENEVRALMRGRSDPGRARLACMARVEAPVTVRPVVSLPTQLAVDAADAGTRRRIVAGVDLGTTTVGALLVDSSGGGRIGSARVPNRQATFGTDVLSRIAAAVSGSADELQEAAVSSVLDALDSAMGGSGTADTPLERVAIAANTAMMSLLLGADVSGLAAHPFRHGLEDIATMSRGPLGDALPQTRILLVPPVVAFVGGDLLAGLIAEGLAEGSSGVIYLDLGTNAEVAALFGDRAVVTSAAAGPAFEGRGTSCGGPAGRGAAVRVVADDSGALRPVTDLGLPTHLTGSGLISALAVLNRLGHLRADGTLVSEGAASGRFFRDEGVLAVSLASDPLDHSVFLTQLDVRELQSAKAAVRVAIERVFEVSGMDLRDLEEVVVTGAFGGSLDSQDLVTLGIVPADASGLVRVSGEAALEGAAMIALRPDLIGIAVRFAGRVCHVDLALGETFADDFIRATSFEPYRL